MLKFRQLPGHTRRRQAAQRRPRGPTVLLAALWLAAWAIPGIAGTDPRTASGSFAEHFDRELAARDVPGGAYAIVHRGQIIGLGTFGHADQARTQAIDSRTVFRIASLSKGFSGVLAATLVSESRFRLDQSISAYVPSFTIGPRSRPLTIEDVLGQRSGFVRNAYDNLLEAGVSRAEIIPRFSKLEPLCAPGECYSYQNNVFSLVEDVIEQTTGQAFSRVLAERVFEPLGMSEASVGYHPFISSKNRANPHLKTRTGWFETTPRTTYYQVPSAAGINASIVDMAHWMIALLGHRPEVISLSAVDEALRPRIRTANELRKRNWRGVLENAWYGLGWRVYQLEHHRLALHAGWVAGYRAEIAFSPELDLGLVILTNAETRAVGELNRFFWDHFSESPVIVDATKSPGENTSANVVGAATSPGG